MGRPADRSRGVVLVTDYGALERALRARRIWEEKNKEKSQ